MINIVINYSDTDKLFKIYESSTDTLIASSSLTEALVNLSNFLRVTGLSDTDILSNSEVQYHLDSMSMLKIVESNVNLIKRLQTAPSGFTISSQKFGGSSNLLTSTSSKKDNSNSRSKFTTGKRSSSFSGRSGFKSSNKKFGNYG